MWLLFIPRISLIEVLKTTRNSGQLSQGSDSGLADIEALQLVHCTQYTVVL